METNLHHIEWPHWVKIKLLFKANFSLQRYYIWHIMTVEGQLRLNGYNKPHYDSSCVGKSKIVILGAQEGPIEFRDILWYNFWKQSNIMRGFWLWKWSPKPLNLFCPPNWFAITDWGSILYPAQLWVCIFKERHLSSSKASLPQIWRATRSMSLKVSKVWQSVTHPPRFEKKA